MQGNSGGEWKVVAGTAAGTSVAWATPKVLDKVIVPAYAEGTVTLFDSATLTGTAAGNQVMVVAGSAAYPLTIPCDLQLKNGLTYLLGGTTSLVLVAR